MRGRIVVSLIVLVVAYLFLQVATIQAQTEELKMVTVTIPINTVVEGDPGSSEVVAILIPADLDAEIGWICDLVGFGDNGESTHPDTNAIIASNGDQVVIVDWERAANTRTEATNGTLTLGATITIAIQVGEDRIASGGLEIQFTCNPPSTTTTTTSETSSTTSTAPNGTTTTAVPDATTTTLSSPPEGGVPAGGGGCTDGACDTNYGVPFIAGVALIGVALLIVAWQIGSRRDAR